ncbi:MAG: hypothetical protein AB1921_03200 [Thermodesulfobacteriota bacterium]
MSSLDFQRNAAAFSQSLEKVLAWSRSRDYEGYSKFDAFNSPVVKALSLNSKYLRMVISPLWARSPVNLRPLFLTTVSRNPKGIGLFATAYIRRYRVSGDPADLAEAENLLAWLSRNHCPGFSGMCWGYDHDWQNLHFLAPKYTPNIVVTGNIAYAFLEAYELTGKAEYLGCARSSVAFMLKDLETPFRSETMRSISYIPGNNWAVLNINGLAAAIMLRVWKHTKEDVLAAEAKKLITFLLDKQTDYGAWHYAWPAKTSNVKHDNYHTGNVLDWILDYITLSGDRSVRDRFEKGLVFFRDHLFTEEGAPKWRSDRTFPLDVHGAAQSIVTLAKAAVEFDPSYFPHAVRTAGWAVRTLQAPEGCFYYQQGRFMTKKYTLMRWCNAWMAVALASLLLAGKTLGEQGGKPCAA